MRKNYIFFQDSGHLRSGFRVAVFIGLVMVLAIPIGPAMAFLVPNLGISGVLQQFFLGGVAACTVAVIAGWICLKLLENLPFSSLGCSFEGTWLKDLGLGLLIGGATFSVACALGALSGGLSFELNPDGNLPSMLQSMGASLAVLSAAAAFEEAFFRGYAFQTLTRANLTWLAIALTSAVFGISHMGNPNASAIGIINTVLAGIWFGVAYLKTKNLWFPFGIHLAWNWVQGNIFGIEISGLSGLSAVPLLKKMEFGPRWLSGGDYGIEAGLVCTVALGLSIVVIWLMPRQVEGSK